MAERPAGLGVAVVLAAAVAAGCGPTFHLGASKPAPVITTQPAAASITPDDGRAEVAHARVFEAAGGSTGAHAASPVSDEGIAYLSRQLDEVLKRLDQLIEESVVVRRLLLRKGLRD
ncbi:MAG: hypothetical protein ACYS0G_09780 [Planctomycetota bacterium]|jgi:hypothetical protein